MTAWLDLDVPRNGHYSGTWTVTNRTTGEPVDLTGCTIKSDARAIAGTGAVLASATIANIDLANGIFGVTWDGSDFDGYGEPTALAKASYDVLIIFPSGIKLVWVRGHLHILSESTYE